MKSKTLFLLTSLCAVSLLTASCTTCPTGMHHKKQYTEKTQHHKKHHKEPKVFQQNYTGEDIEDVTANIYTRSVNGGESAMGTIKFKETDNGLKMKIDLIDLRPGKIYTAQIYQCGTCNSGICCATETMNIDLPTIKSDSTGNLPQSFIVRGLTATQLNNAKLILTRDGGYKAAWGTLNQ